MCLQEWLYECVPFLPVLLASLIDTRWCPAVLATSNLYVSAIVMSGHTWAGGHHRIVIVVEADYAPELCRLLRKMYPGCFFDDSRRFHMSRLQAPYAGLRGHYNATAVYTRILPRYTSVLALLGACYAPLGLHGLELVQRSWYLHRPL